MDNLFLIKKGVKARKKRLGGGGGGGLIGTKLIAYTSKSGAPTNLSSVELTVEDTTNGTQYVDASTGVVINGRPVADMVAHQNGLVPSASITNGTINLSAGTEYRIVIAAFLHQNMTGSGTEVAGCVPLTDVGNNFANNDLRINPALGTLPAPYRSPYGNGFIITVTGSCVAGELIIQVANTNGGADTNSNVIAGSASPSDAYHLKIVLS